MTPLVPDFVLEQDALGQYSGKFTSAALFLDISGFTNMTEKLMQHGRRGAEALADTLRFYFDPLIESVHEAGGFITGFAGDAFTALFPHAPDRNVASYAVTAARKMQRFIREHPRHTTPYATFPFTFKMGLAFGDVQWGIVHVAPERAYYYFHGAAIDACTSISHDAQKGEILLTTAFHERVPTEHTIPVNESVRRLAPAAPKLPPRPAAPARSSIRSGLAAVRAGPGGRRTTSGTMAAVRVSVLPPVVRPVPPGTGAKFLAPGISDLPRQGEFRNVTSVFLAFDQMDSLSDLTKLLHELANRYGGTFTGLDSGDKGINCLIHFGAPITHENDTERALDFTVDLKRSAPRPMLLRAGITRDIRYAGFNGGTQRQEFACLGRATNLAARLMMHAEWKQILCDEAVATYARSNYQFEPQAAATFKGFDQPLPIFSLERKKVSPQKEFLAKGLIGRQAELDALASYVSPIFSGRFAGIVYIDGEAGLGKSYLVNTYHASLIDREKEQPFLWIDARCDQTLRSSLNPFEYALKEYFWQTTASGREEKHSNFDDALDSLVDRLADSETMLRRELVRMRSVFAALIGLRWQGSMYERLDPKLRFSNTLTAICTWIRAETSLQPVILHLEDAHWADGDSIDALRAIVEACRDRPLAIVCTCRRMDDGTPFRVRMEGDMAEQAVSLRPLLPDQVRTLAADLIGGDVSEVLAVFLCNNAGGNPYFAQEIVAFWLEDNQMRAGENTGVTSPSVFLLPNDVNSLLIARLDRLEPRVKKIIQAASVLGREFDLRILTTMVDRESDIQEIVRIGEEQCIWSALSEMRYQFSNVLLRNAAYEMQSRARLVDLHRRAAEGIEAVYAEDLDGREVELGRHWQRAGEPDNARRYYLAGARKAVERYAHGEARRLYRAYFKLTSDPTPESVIVRYELARDVLEVQGRNQEAMQEHFKVLDEAMKIGDRDSEALGLLGLGRVHAATGRAEGARAFFEQALALAREAESPWIEGLAIAKLAVFHKDQGRLDVASSLAEQALVIARNVQNRKEELNLLDVLAALHREQGQTDRAAALAEQAQAIEREMGLN